MTVSPEERRNIEWDCHKLALRFTALTDAQEYDALAGIFTEDALFARPTDPDNPVRGRDNILAAFKERPTNKITRHLITNVAIDVHTADRAAGRMYATLYTGDTANEAEHGIQAAPKQFVGEFFDEYVRTEDGWRIAKRTGGITFTVEPS